MVAVCSEHELYEVVSRIFWEQALTRDIAVLRDEVAESKGFRLIRTAVDCGSDALCAFLARFASNEATVDVGDPLFLAMAGIAEREVMRNGNFEGVIYVDELASRSPPRFQRVARSSIERSAVTFSVTRGRLARGGVLCLRSPLPALVQCGREPPDVFLVEDTQSALSQQRVVLMKTHSVTKLSEGAYVARGTLLVFLNEGESPEFWREWVPNAHFVLSGGNFVRVGGREGDVLEVRSVIT